MSGKYPIHMPPRKSIPSSISSLSLSSPASPLTRHNINNQFHSSTNTHPASLSIKSSSPPRRHQQQQPSVQKSHSAIELSSETTKAEKALAKEIVNQVNCNELKRDGKPHESALRSFFDRIRPDPDWASKFPGVNNGVEFIAKYKLKWDHDHWEFPSH
jgi:hypothetical protein